MISYAAYRVIHLVGIVFLLVVLGGVSYAARRPAAGAPGEAAGPGPSRRLAMILHGVAMLVVLVGGFGLMARLGTFHGAAWPGWIWAKLGIWLLMGAAVVIPRRKPEWAGALFIAIPVLGGVAAWLAIYKPF